MRGALPTTREVLLTVDVAAADPDGGNLANLVTPIVGGDLPAHTLNPPS